MSILHLWVLGVFWVSQQPLPVLSNMSPLSVGFMKGLVNPQSVDRQVTWAGRRASTRPTSASTYNLTVAWNVRRKPHCSNDALIGISEVNTYSKDHAALRL